MTEEEFKASVARVRQGHEEILDHIHEVGKELRNARSFFDGPGFEQFCADIGLSVADARKLMNTPTVGVALRIFQKAQRRVNERDLGTVSRM